MTQKSATGNVHLGNFSEERSVTYTFLQDHPTLAEVEALVERARRKGALETSRLHVAGKNLSFTWLTEHAFLGQGVSA